VLKRLNVKQYAKFGGTILKCELNFFYISNIRICVPKILALFGDYGIQKTFKVVLLHCIVFDSLFID